MDDLFVETSVAARRWWKHLSLKEEMKTKTTSVNQVISRSVGNTRSPRDLRDLFISTSGWPEFASLSRYQRFNQTPRRSSAVFRVL